MTNLRTPDDYQRAIDQTFERLDKGRRAPRLLSGSTAHWLEHTGPKVAGFVIAAGGVATIGGGAVGAAMLIEQGAGGGGAMMAVAGFLLGFPSVIVGIVTKSLQEDEYARDKWRTITDPILALTGHTYPLDTVQAEKMKEWAKKQPRLLEIISRWSEVAPSHPLTHADYRAMRKTIKRVETLEEHLRLASTGMEVFEGTEIGTAMKHGKLKSLSSPERDDNGNKAPTPRM